MTSVPTPPAARLAAAAIALVLLFTPIRHAAAQITVDPSAPGIPTIELSPAARRAIEAPFLTDEERRDKRLFHGSWIEEDLADPARRAQAAIVACNLLDPVFDDESAPARLRAQRLVLMGETEQALALLEGEESPAGRRLRAEALEWSGRFAEADEAIEPILSALADGRLASAEDLTEAARCLAMRARLRGEPASRYHAILQIASRVHQQIDRLYWPAKLVEARLLVEKDNPREAADAIVETLSLNPRCAEAWMLLAQIQLDNYNFAAVESLVRELDRLGEDHVLARIVLAQLDLVQGLPDEAARRLDRLLASMPKHRHALALRAAVEAVRYDEDGLHLALRDFEMVSGRHPFAWYTAGVYLSRNRQYDLAAEVLAAAIERQPNWPAPRIELGLMHLQSGEDAAALTHLRRACSLDPFNVRAAFSLHLLESLARYETVSSEHFTVRFDPDSADRALAMEMLGPLERMHGEISTALQHEPARRTQIELMPNHSRFAVRITGMPQVHTIAACTGPVIAMEAPRAGPDHFGTYNWLRVLRHEYVHTITLSRTRNRIPHWLTEAAAVWLEDAPRDYNTCTMLAQAHAAGDLFTLDEINWAFVRPKRPNDRSLAYAQGHWMIEFLVERFGHAPLLRLLDEYAEGFREDLAIPAALGVSRGQFYEQFVEWAGRQVQQWGLAPRPTMEDLVRDYLREDPEFAAQVAQFQREYGLLIIEQLRKGATGRPRDPLDWINRSLASLPEARSPRPELTDRILARWLELFPDHPDLLRLRITRLRGTRRLGADMIPLLDRYAAARPVDPMPQQMLAAIHLESDNPARAIPYLESVDRLQKYDHTYAVELARLHQKQGRFDIALDRINRAVTIAPYEARLREEAAAIAIQARRLEEAKRHVIALTILEPDRTQHAQRLEALERLMGEGG